MNQLTLSGILLIGGFITILAATISGPPGLYQEPDNKARLDILSEYPTRWWISNSLHALAGVITALGLVSHSLQLRGTVSDGVITAASGIFSLGTLGWVIWMVYRTVNPASYFNDYSFSLFTTGLLTLILLGLLLYGTALQLGGYPGWLAQGTIAGMVLIGSAAIIYSGRFFASFPPQVFFIFTLASGIVLVRG